MLKLVPDDPRPAYRQVADGVRAEIDAGNYEPGERLPSYGVLAKEFGVSLGVVKRAMTQLRDERVIVIRHGQGSYVRTDRDGGETGEVSTMADVQAALAEMATRLDAVERWLSEL